MPERSLLAIFAHPDDETFRCGGTLALLGRDGVRVQVLTATAGEAGSCGDPPLCSPDELATRRAGELACACAALGLEPPRLLRYADGHLVEANVECLIEEVLAAISETGAQVLLSFGPDGLSGHSDHIAVGGCASEAYRRAESVAALYTVAVPNSVADVLGMRQVHAVPDEAITLTVDVSAAWEEKQAAIRCHASQWSASPMLKAPAEHQRRFFGTEHFVRAIMRSGTNDFLPEALMGHLL